MFCAYTRPRYQVGVYRTIGPLATLCYIKAITQFSDTALGLWAR